MMMYYYSLVSLIFIFLSTVSPYLEARSRLKATLDFGPSAIVDIIESSLHSPRVYYCGKIVSTYPHGTKVSFDVAKNDRQNRFYILVVQEFNEKRKDALVEGEVQNTIDHLYVKSSEPYRFFILDLVADEFDSDEISFESSAQGEMQKNYHWLVHEERLSEDGAIPDSTIIVCYFPHLLAEIKGESPLALPTLYFNIESLAYGNDTMRDALAYLQLASINMDTIHAPSKRKTETKNNRLLIMDIT